jgi:hypothetical protein
MSFGCTVSYCLAVAAHSAVVGDVQEEHPALNCRRRVLPRSGEHSRVLFFSVYKISSEQVERRKNTALFSIYKLHVLNKLKEKN